MSDFSQFKVGDCLIDTNQVFVIYQIDKTRLYYKPFQPDDRNNSITGSIPITNGLTPNLRPLITNKEINQFFTELASVPAPTEPIDAKFYKDVVVLNNPLKIIPLLKQLWLAKARSPATFTGNNRDILENILVHVSNEFSIVTKKPAAGIRTKITGILQKSVPTA